MDTLRISDADRESALAQLGEQYALGRLSKEELDERSDAVWSAKTRGDLAPVFADLPTLHPSGRTARSPYPVRPGRGRRIPVVPVLVALGAITVLTHLPVVLIGLAVWFFWIRPRWPSHILTHRGWTAQGANPSRGHHG